MKAMRHETKRSATCGTPRNALTLTELLIVVFIMGILLSVSVPAIKPMLETEKTRNAADSIASYLNQARIKAMETGLPCGVQFERYAGMEMEDSNNNVYYPYNGACLQLRQIAVPKPYGGCTEGSRVNVSSSGSISFLDSAESSFWGNNGVVRQGDRIQFDYQGPKYQITNIGGSNALINWREFDPNAATKQMNNVPFKVYRSARPTLVAPLRFPLGVVVDLHVSGKNMVNTNYSNQWGLPFLDNSRGTSYIPRDDFTPSGQNDRSSVTIMFLPNGEVDYVSSSLGGTDSNNNPIFLCVGLWDRMGFWSEDPANPGTFYVDNAYLPDDIPSGSDPCGWNYRDLNNFWVTVFPKNGRVIVQPMSYNNYSLGNQQNTALQESREYARDIQGIGGR